jgi:hypothetical protein
LSHAVNLDQLRGLRLGLNGLPDSHGIACGGHLRHATIPRSKAGHDILRGVIVAVEQSTWDLWGQLGVWLIGFPLFLGILGTYIAFQIITERRENQKISGRWGLKAKSQDDDET